MTLDPSATALSIAPPDERAWLSRRWRHWEPLVLIHLQSLGLRAPSPAAVRASHREWCISLRARGLALDNTIHRLSLDDPRQPRLVLMAKVELYLERRAKQRPQRIKP